MLYKNDMGSFRARYGSMTRSQYSPLPPPENRGRENAFFCAGIEEVKWKSLIHWTAQTFSARPLLNLCGLQKQTENLSFAVLLMLPCHDSPLSEATLLTQCACPEHWKMNQFTTVYHYKCQKYIQIATFDVLNTRCEFVASIQSFVALKNILDWYKLP